VIRTKSLAALLASVLCAAAIAACAGKTVMVDGRQVPYAQASNDAFAQARSSLVAGKYDEAADEYGRAIQDFPDSDQCDEARLRRAQALERGGKLEDAQTVLQEMLEKHPETRFKNPAAMELTLVQKKLAKRAGAATAQPKPPVIAQMSEAERQDAAQTLSAAYAPVQNGAPSSLHDAARAVEADPSKLAAYKDQLAEASYPDIAALITELDQKSPAWPDAALRLASLELHTGDRVHAQALATEVRDSQPGTSAGLAAQNLLSVIGATGNVKPVLVGVVLPLTGELKQFAAPTLDAIALYLDPNGKGPIQVSVKDSKSDPDGAAHAVEELAREGVIAIIGPIGLAEGPAAAVRAQQLGIPMISLSRAEGLTAIGPYIFRDMLTNSATARAVAEYAMKKLNAHSFGVLQPDSNYGDEMVRYFWDTVDSGGGEVRAYERYPVETTTFKPFISKMVGKFNLGERGEYLEEERKIAAEITDPYRRRKALAQAKNNTAPLIEFDALFIPDSARKVRLIAPAVAAEDVITSGCDTRDLEVIKKTTKRGDDLRTVQLLGTNLWDSNDLVDERMGAARYVQCAIFADGFFPQSQRGATKAFVAEYDSAYHRVPSYIEAYAHDVAGIVRGILEKQRPQTRDQFRDTLATMSKPFPGATGETRFGPDREAQKNFFWLWINRGQITEFDPDGNPPVPPAPAAPGK
jgi:ABC-type branched-subunit amino acid transport system substrate-binding protein